MPTQDDEQPGYLRRCHLLSILPDKDLGAPKSGPGVTLAKRDGVTGDPDLSPRERRALSVFETVVAPELASQFCTQLYTHHLLLSAVHEEALRSGVIALSTMYEHSFGTLQAAHTKVPDFVLDHYGRAIHAMTRLNIADTATAFDVALLGCLIFASLEILQGHYMSAYTHITSGIKVLEEKNDAGSVADGGALVPPVLLRQVFVRMQTECLELNLVPSKYPKRLSRHIKSGSKVFTSTAQAMLSISAFLNRTMLFLRDEDEGIVSQTTDQNNIDDVTRKQKRLVDEFLEWSHAFTALPLEACERSEDIIICEFYRTYISIILSLDFHKGETAFDDFDKEFQDMIFLASMFLAHVSTILPGCQPDKLGTEKRIQVIAVPNEDHNWFRKPGHFLGIRPDCTPICLTRVSEMLQPPKIGRPVFPILPQPGSFYKPTYVSVGLGIVGPLFAVCVRCRNTRIRRQALYLLEMSNRIEGLWDSRVTARISRALIDFEIAAVPSLTDQSPSSAIPEHARVKEVQADLVNLRQGVVYVTQKAAAVENAAVENARGDKNTSSHAVNDIGSSGGHAIAWEASGGIKDNVVQTSKFLQELYGFMLGEKMVITRCDDVVQDLHTVTVVAKDDTILDDERTTVFWEKYAELTAKSAHEYLVTGQTLSFKVGSQSQQFLVEDVGQQVTKIGKLTDQTRFQITAASTKAASKDERGPNFTSGQLGGLQHEIKKVQKLIGRLVKPGVPLRAALSPAQGVLIFGARGVGKSHFIKQLSLAGWKTVIEWKPGTKNMSLNQPSLIIVSRRYIPKPSEDSSKNLNDLHDVFRAVKDRPCLVIGEVTHPNDVHPDLRTLTTFSEEIEIPIPSASQRKEILSAIWGSAASDSYSWVIDQLAERTHGYVAADLYRVLRLTLDSASERKETNSPSYLSSSSPPTIIPSDIDAALSQVRPSALQEIFLETPSVRWSDIGGQQAIKQQLINAVERPLKHAAQMAKMSLPAKKGLLMYGPPGCSKTLLVRALAREAGLNFLAVKGAELISQYVGESERAMREVFRKARAASPSILFFDEIDSIASTRSSSSPSSSSSLNVLTTLLNEMDGFEPLRNVFVVAATNKPESIDPALLRPGRFDDVVYIGPPDLDARTEILRKELAKSNYTPRQGSSVDEDARYFAERTEARSGAEVVAVRTTACGFALDRGEDVYGFEDVQRGLECVGRSISKEMVAGFERWAAARAGG
ncbi:hypothetical protein DV736_g4056, partial [Chaetothyriales sp. CBS 134916]